MTYSGNVPQGGDLISDSQSELLTNFQQLNLVYGDTNPGADPNSDHYAFDDGSANARKHRKIRLVRQVGGAGIPTPAATDGVAYVRVSATQTIPFYRKDAGTVDFPLLPVRAMVRYTNVAIPIVVGTAFNVASVVRAGGEDTITFTEAMPDANYLVFAFQQNNLGTAPATLTSHTLIAGSFVIRNVAGTAQEFYVAVLHYAA
ncbi:MAG: hypothetical protein K940chlam3_00133 [Chlamydiae bacterium]|nr:hypothetical protein [Chlamydiota bacterium]